MKRWLKCQKHGPVENRALRWNKLAINQFQGMIEYIAQDSPSNAEKIAHEVLNQIERLTTHPDIHTPDKYKTNNDGNYRAFELHRFRVAYYASKKEVRILRVRHTSQEPKLY